MDLKKKKRKFLKVIGLWQIRFQIVVIHCLLQELFQKLIFEFITLQQLKIICRICIPKGIILYFINEVVW